MEYWNFGVMGENGTAAYKACFKAYRDMIICSVDVIGKNNFRAVWVKHFNEPCMPGNAFSITPLLHYSNTAVLLSS